MSTRVAKGDAAVPLPVKNDERRAVDVDSFIARNREALNASIRQSREEVAAGKTSAKSMDEIISEGRKRREK